MNVLEVSIRYSLTTKNPSIRIKFYDTTNIVRTSKAINEPDRISKKKMKEEDDK